MKAFEVKEGGYIWQLFKFTEEAQYGCFDNSDIPGDICRLGRQIVLRAFGVHIFVPIVASLVILGLVSLPLAIFLGSPIIFGVAALGEVMVALGFILYLFLIWALCCLAAEKVKEINKNRENKGKLKGKISRAIVNNVVEPIGDNELVSFIKTYYRAFKDKVCLPVEVKERDVK